MINKKPEIVKALQKIPDVEVFFYYPESFQKLPCISYFELSNLPCKFADDQEYLTEIEIQVDLWAKTSIECSTLFRAVNEQMNKIGFSRFYAMDNPNPHSFVKQKVLKFKFIGG